MIRRGLWALLLAAAPADDRAAQDLLKSVQQRIEKARSIRLEGQVSIEGDEGGSDATFSVKIRGKDRWAVEVRQTRARRDSVGGFDISATCDGRKILLAGAPPGSSLTGLQPDEGARLLRSAITSCGISGLETVLSRDPEEKALPPAVKDVKDGGAGRVGDLEARIIEYTLVPPAPPDDNEVVRLFLDPQGSRPLRKESLRGGVKTVELYTAFALDEEFPDSDFVYQSARRLGRVRTAELARCVALYASFTGRHPRMLEDLVRRPADLEPEVFFPAGGFVLGGAVPKDPWGRPFELRVDAGGLKVVGLGSDGRPGGSGDAEDSESTVAPASRRPVGAPTERLRNQYTARVQLQLLAGAVRFYRDATGGLPRKKAAFWEKTDDGGAWPEGGFLPGGRVPLDPWGQPYRIISDPDRVRVQVADPEARLLPLKALSADESKALQAVAQPRLDDAERRAVRGLLDRLSEDDLDAREKAEQELKRWGPGIHGELEARLKTEKDGETRLRIEAIRRASPPRRPAWSKELAALTITITAIDELQGDQALLTSCANNLSQLWKLQHVYMSQFGGRMKRMPDATGKDFWLSLAKTQPPLIDPTVADIFVCPASGVAAGVTVCTYRGPARNVAQMADGDIVGMCDDESHGEQVVILRKSGDALVISRAEPGYEEALKTTKP